MTPSFCVVNYRCDRVAFTNTQAVAETSSLGCGDFNFIAPTNDTPGSITMTASPASYQDGSKPPGTYKIWICAEVELASPAEEKCSEIDVVLEDPCDPPDSISKPPFTGQTYTISDANKADYTHPEFEVSPDICKVGYTYDLGSITNKGGDARSAITRTDETFSFFYDEDLAPYL